MTDPRTLLDVGVGFGKYGLLAREFLETWGSDKQYASERWTRTIDGIEVFEDYLTPVHDYIYDRILVGNALDLLPTLDEVYDLILLIDILEHFEHVEGLRILQECERHSRNLLISVPRDIGSQQETFGNPFETHRFQWEKRHLQALSRPFTAFPVGVSLIVYSGEKASDIDSIWRRRSSPMRKIAISLLDLFHLRDPVRRLLRR